MQGNFLTAVAKQTTVRAKHCQHVFCIVYPRFLRFTGSKFTVAVCFPSPLSGSAASVSTNRAGGLSLRVINPAVRMRHNETKPLDPAVSHPLVARRWRMAIVG